MEKVNLSKELLLKVTELGFQGYHAINKGVLFILDKAEDPVFYLKQNYVKQVKEVSDEQQNLITNYLETYNPQTEIIVFHLTELILLDAFQETGKNLDDYAPRTKPIKPTKPVNPKKIPYQKK
jgi:hypothetical protein